jgi:predicted lipid-binding transport protein (Tim44 family)
LRPLLSDDVFENFSSAIRARQAARQTLETTLVSLDSASIIEARLEGRTAFVTVKFVSQQINVTLNAANEIVDGDPKQIAVLTDIWTFGRSTRSRDPNWALVQTSNPM